MMKNANMKRVVNYRPACFFALSQAAGIWSVLLAGEAKTLRFISLSIALGLILALVIFGIFNKRVLRFLYLPIALIIGITVMSGAADLYDLRKMSVNNAEIEARVISAGAVSESENYVIFIVDKIYVNGEKLSGKMSVIVPAEDFSGGFNGGDTVRFSGDVKTPDFGYFDTYFALDYGKRIYNFCFADNVEKAAEGRLPFIYSLTYNTNKRIYENTKEDTAGIASGLLFGGHHAISSSLYDDIRASGLVHILSVSGLHVAILASAAYWILKKLRLKPWPVFFITSALLIAYSLLCGLVPPVIRSSLMFIVFLLAKATGRKPDNITTLALSAVPILLFNPLSLCDVGFLLSYGAMLGLLLFYGTAARRFKTLKNPFLSIAAASVFSALFTIPFVAEIFGGTSAVFVLMNLLILPIMTFIYLFLLIISVIVMIVPNFAFLMASFDYAVIPIKIAALLSGSFRFSTVALPKLGVIWIAYALGLIILSEFVFLNRKQKMTALSAVWCAALVLSVAF
jgi:competence protein ComEC